MSKTESKIVEFRSPAGDLLRQVAECGQEKPWFIAKDVCEALGITHQAKAVALLDDDERGYTQVHTLGGSQEMAIVSEPGLYSLIGRSRKPEAKAFKRWVNHEVLPSIRRTGSYSTQAGPRWTWSYLRPSLRYRRVVCGAGRRAPLKYCCVVQSSSRTGAAVRAAYVSSDGVRRRQGCVPGCTPFKS